MIRAAFPTLPEDLEKKETTWIRTAFDCAGANGQGSRRLAGVWAPLPVALHLADDYDLSDIITPLANATPDPKNVPRRSTRSSAAAAENNNLTSMPPSPGKTKTPPAKRRRAESPKSPAALNASLPALSQDTRLPVSTRKLRDSASPGRTTRSSASPGRQVPLRRSLRSPKPSTPTVHELDDHDRDPEDVPLSVPDLIEDIEESKAIVAAVKKAAAESDGMITSVAVKRSHAEDTQLTLNIRHPPAEEQAVARPIATNRRITMTPARKAAAWGALAFSIGLGAMSVCNASSLPISSKSPLLSLSRTFLPSFL
jgi:hypothetical protein